jgi:hypothetical protein
MRAVSRETALIVFWSQEWEETVGTSNTATTNAEAQVSAWHRYPTLYEINTWVWLFELSQKYGTEITLSRVPGAEWDSIAAYGFEAVWLMGVWERSPAGIAVANHNPGLQDDFRRALPDFRPEDNKGSAYCIRRYTVDPYLGGPDGLAAARQELAKRGMKLVLDYVPNHVALDHPWVAEHPEYFILGSSSDAHNDPASYFESGGRVYAHGRDPYFPAWTDVLQLNAFSPGLRQAAISTVTSIAGQCDGVRCDMAMLLLNEIFQRTWGERAGSRPATEYWTEIVSAAKGKFPAFVFIAEAYWDKEWDLMQLGFDFCYDKKLYDRLQHDSIESIRQHLQADLSYQQKLLRFIENHDEPRAAAVFPPAKERAAALMIATLPGIRLFHEGQFEGRTVKLPVFLGRRRVEPVDEDLRHFYETLLKATDRPVFRDGEWTLCKRSGWPDNASFQDLVVWHWLGAEERYVVVVNFANSSAQARIQIPWTSADDGKWQLLDMMSGALYERAGAEMRSPGLFVDLKPWGYHFLQCRRVHQS